MTCAKTYPSFFYLKRVLMAGLMLAGTTMLHASDDLIENGTFEHGKSNWRIYIPDGNDGVGAQFDITQEAQDGVVSSVACLKSTETARFCISQKKTPTLEPGRYRLQARVRAGDDFEPKKWTPGFVVRLTQKFKDGRKPVHVFVNWKGQKSTSIKFPGQDPLPTSWTTIEVVLGVDDTTRDVSLDFFIWEGKGSVYLDDVSLVRLD
ncbi:hypothetical protein [Ruficoccus sp. ZRK36]|uniref:hypothetical protein n=1 Tax=Ruficoccus sp. ZRK36 TaxID=2866311 RepID=UPI001C739A96|nr:hypothetical protein [Ruficoccus sp. ZRK36]QYY37407.1 hypothetical protein K0V07_07955 [Ruficoccus sp. ZRK36]